MEHQQQPSDILLNTFLINKKRYRVLLNFDKIEWEAEQPGRGKATLLLSDIITVKESSKRKSPTKPNPPGMAERNFLNSPPKSEPASLTAPPSGGGSQFLIIYYAKRLINGRSDCNTLRKMAITLYNADSRITAHWHRSLMKIIGEQQSRPRHILMFVNPFGGRQQGLGLYERFCKPLFQLAGIEISCVISQRANQIRDIIMTQCLDAYDAICCVGGDGTFAELSNGLIYRAMKEEDLDPLRPEYIPKPKLPIGVIPAGSTDTVAYSMHGTNDVRTAALHIILGQKRGLVMCSVCNGNGLIKFCASLLSYGYLGDVALESENYRWMGPKRYEYAGVKKFINNHGYSGEVIILDDGSNAETADEDIAICSANCERCFNSTADGDVPSSTTTTPIKSDGKIFCHQDMLQLQEHSRTPAIFCDNLNSCRPKPDLDTGGGGQSGWKSIKGTFFMISGTNMTCSCARSPNGISKYSHLGDGYIDVIVVRHTTLLQNLQFVKNSLGASGDIRKLPFVEIYRTRKFFFRLIRPEDEASIAGSCQPISPGSENSKTSQWNCDGEIIHDSDVFMTSHCQLIDVFMRGPHTYDSDLHGDLSCCKGFC